jgi:cob(I)alamin adenosyltransferase
VKIYTKTGDAGSTGLFGGSRVDKDDARVDAYGTVDETNAAVGLARALGVVADVDAVLGAVQNDLFRLGAELASAPGHEAKLKLRLLDADDTARLERAIDAAEAGLPPLAVFILPGGSPGAAALHVARTACRRAERGLVLLRRTSPVRDELLVYLNRLSDLFFVLARKANHDAGAPDVPWEKG